MFNLLKYNVTSVKDLEFDANYGYSTSASFLLLLQWKIGKPTKNWNTFVACGTFQIIQSRLTLKNWKKFYIVLFLA